MKRKGGGKVSIIIPNWNGRALLEKNLPRVVEAGKVAGNGVAEVIVVDDGSSDESVKFLERNYSKEVRIVRHTKNRGFSAAVNTGVRMAKGELCCLLNTDVVPERGFLKNVVGHFKDNKVFAISLHERGYGRARGFFKNGFVEHKGDIEAKRVAASFWASGGSGVFRRKIWMELKGMDGELFSPFYWEDVDICYRAQKRGYLVYWEPGAWVRHEHEAVINETNFKRRRLGIIKERNQILFIWKNITSSRMTRKHVRGLLKRLIRHPGYVVVVYEAMKKRKTVMSLRAVEKRESKVSDEAIFARFQD